MNHPLLFCAVLRLFLSIALVLPVNLAHAAGNISAAEKYAWSESAGWQNFAPAGGGVTVYSDHLERFAWGENIGWIKLGSHSGGGPFTYANSSNADWGVNRSGGTLSGYAWSETCGWINFGPAGGGVSLDGRTGVMDGWAWGENIGWLRVRSASPAYGVRFYPSFGVSAIVFDGATGYAAQDGGGIWKSTDSGATWGAVATQPVNQRIRGLVIHPTTRSTLYATSYGGGVFKSIDSGGTWLACSGQPANPNTVSLAIDSAGILYTGTEGGIFTSSDCSAWTAINSGLTVAANKPPMALAIDPATPATIYAGLDGGGVYKTTNSGGLWIADATLPANLRVKRVVIKPDDSARLFAAGYGSGVFTSADSGATWSACASTGLTNLNVVALTIDSGGKLYAGTEAGVFVSSNGCGTWIAMNSGLP